MGTAIPFSDPAFRAGLAAAPEDDLMALALGADAVLLARLYVYGLGLAGRDGVRHVLRCLVVTLGLAGYADIAELTPDALVRAPADELLHRLVTAHPE